MKLLNKILKNRRDYSKVLSNLSSLALLQIANYIFPLIVLPYLVTVLGVEKYGVVSFAGAIIAYLQTFTSYGFNFTATRDVAKNRSDMVKLSDIFSEVFFAQIVLVFISLLLYLPVLYFVNDYKGEYLVFVFAFLTIPSHVLFPEWFFQGIEEMKFITILNLSAKLLFTLLIFIVIKEESDYVFVPLLNSIGFFIAGITAMVIIIFKYKINIRIPSIISVLHTYKDGFAMFINQFLPYIYKNSNAIILGAFVGYSAVGIFTAAQRTIDAANSVTKLLTRAFYPFLNRNANKHDAFKKIILLTGVALTAGVFIFSDLIVQILLTDEFADSVHLLRIMSLSLIMLSVYSCYGTNYLLVFRQDKKILYNAIAASVIGVILAVPLIMLWGYFGAAVNIVISNTILATGVYISALRYSKSLKGATNF